MRKEKKVFIQYAVKHTISKINKDILLKDNDTIIKSLYQEGGHHGISHIHQVLNNAIDIKKTPLNKLEELACILHDISCEYRDSHHIIGSMVTKELLKGIFTYKEILLVKNAVLKHRSSYKGNFKNGIEELVSSADRDKPSSIKDIFMRSYCYAIDKGKDHQLSIVHAYLHIKSKYGINGTANIPNMYFKHYIKELSSFYNKLELLSLEECHSFFN